MSKKNKDLLVYIERNSLTFGGGPFDDVVKINLEEKIVSDLEIVDKKQFIEIVQSQVKKSEIITNLILIFSNNASFFKELPIDSTKEQLNLAEKSFLSLIPFDRVAHKLIKFTKHYQLVGINLGMRDVLKEALMPLGYKLLATIPAIVISGFDHDVGLNGVVMDQIESKMASLKPFNLSETSNESNESLINQVTTQKKSYMPILVGVFILLICLLTLLLLRR